MTAVDPGVPDIDIPAGPSEVAHDEPSEAAEWALHRVRTYARRRVAWLRHLWSAEGAEGVGGSHPPANAVTHAEVDALLEGHDTAEREAAWGHESSQGRALSYAIDEVEEAWRRARGASRWARLQEALGLADEDVDVLQFLFAVHLQPSLARLCAYLHDDAALRYPSTTLVGRLFGHARAPVLSSTGLREWRLVTEAPPHPGEPVALTLDPAIVAWLLAPEDDAAPGELTEVPSVLPLPSWPVAESVAWARSAMERSGYVRMTVVGEAGSGRRTFVSACAARLGQRLRIVDAAHLDADAALAAVRRARLEGETLAWLGPPPAGLTTVGWMEWVLRQPDEAIPPLAEGGDLLTRTVTLPLPSAAEREGLWRTLVPGAASWSADEVTSLASRFRLHPGEVRAVGRQDPATPAAAEHLVRVGGRSRLDRLAEVVESPFTWDDLVVGDLTREMLEDLESTARSRAAVWERPGPRRLFPGGRGLLALFSGPPGTGKTMTAQVLAASLGVDLVRIDLSQVVSKYVGETSQNLDRILRRAERLDVVLLFDEADAIFGRRTEVKDAHDRYANTDTAYLLQAMEQYPGLAVLSTNRKADIDPAFLRRFRFIVEFEKPGPDERAAIWRRVLGELAVAEEAGRLGPALGVIAAGVEATGAQIKFAALGAVLRAEREGVTLEAAHLLDALGRELRKDGRAFGTREQERLLREATRTLDEAAERL